MVNLKRTYTKTYEIIGVALDSFTYDAQFKAIRDRFKRKYSSCFYCQRDFKDDEKISLTMIKNHVNETLFHDCALKVQENLKSPSE